MIEVKNLNKTYDRGRAGDHRVLKDVSFTLPDKGFVCILGPSGCGKTSLLNAIGGLDRFDNGSLCAGDTTVNRYGTAAYEAERNRNFGYIFQNYYLLDQHSVAYNVYLGLHSLDLTHTEKLKRVRMALKAVDMERYIRRKVSDLSGGQQQRIAIARALARRPRVIFADEPTGNLDEANTRNICTLLRQAARESLVVMVTHEEHIANFFADRIIRLDQGRISSDHESWDRDHLQLRSDKEIYTGDFQQLHLREDQISLRLLQREGAAPIELTVVAEKDRIILKLSDSRAITLSDATDTPKIIEGDRPVVTLESISQDSGSQSALFREAPAGQCKAGKGISFSMMLRESTGLMKGKGLKRASMRIFLVLLTVLTLLTVADFITISKVDPQDFITADSHILKVTVTKGENTVTDGSSPPLGYYTWYNYHMSEYIKGISQAGTDFDFIPQFSNQPEYTLAMFYQMANAKQRFPAFSYTLIDRLAPEDLRWGKMPASSEEVVIDRILLDAMLESEGIVQNGIRDYTSFLGERLLFNKSFNPVIVGVSDSGERSIYATKSTLYALGTQGTPLITVSELKERYPGRYETLVMSQEGKPDQTFDLNQLSVDECIINTAQAGVIWKFRLEQYYGSWPNEKKVRGWLENEDLSAWIIVADEAVDQMIINNYSDVVTLWCADKASMKQFLSQPTALEQEGYLQIKVSDPYAQTYAAYQRAASLRADARTIVTATILILCMVMLYLLCKTQANERLGLVAVYRLLGIPGKKLHGIFLMEGIISSVGTILPTAALTWLGVFLAEKIPELESTLELPWQAAVTASCCILLYYLAVTLLPLFRLLRLPPAQLAAKYDM